MYAGALSTLGLASDPLIQNRYGVGRRQPRISYIEPDGHMAIADGGGGGAGTRRRRRMMRR